MSPIYTRDTLRDDVNSRLHNKIGILSNVDNMLNRAVLEVFADTDLRSAKRKASLAPNLFTEVYQYTCPADLKGYSLVDLQRQKDDRPKSERWELTTEEQFDATKAGVTNKVAFSDRDFTRKLLIAKQLDDDNISISPLDSLTSGGGTWTTFGDGTNIRADADNYVKGNGSLKYDINADGGTTAGIQNTGLSEYDITNHLSGSVFAWADLTDVTDITNLKVRLLNDANYYEMTATTTNEGLSFVNGWNLIRWALSGRTESGSVTTASMNGAVLYMTKATGKTSEVDYRFDNLVIKNGEFYNIIYYTKYPWQSSTGTYLANSTDDTDLLNVDADEYNMALEKCVDKLGRSAREYRDADDARVMYKELRDEYILNNPSESLLLTTTYYEFGSIDGDF